MKVIHFVSNMQRYYVKVNLTSSSAVAKRPCDASCLSVVSFNSTKRRVEQSLLLLVTYATDLSLRAVKCAVLLSLA